MSLPAKTKLGVWLIVIIGWCQLFNGLRSDWSLNPQYGYGWVVPLLSLGLFMQRWHCRPAEVAQHRPTWVAWCMGLSLLLPIRLIQEANPEWRLIFWVHGVLLVGLTLALMYYQGGFPWVRHFAFPVAFLLVSIPWPTLMEQWLITDLMRGVAAITAEIVSMVGIPAVQRGNLIEIGQGMVGVDEACSGVRSMQSTLMIALFFGEYYRMILRRRLTLLAGGLGIAFLANLARTTFLVLVAGHQGIAQLARWHDAAGVAIMCVVMPAIWGLALWLRPSATPHPSTPTPGFYALPRMAVIAVVLWFVCVEVATGAWYGIHEAKLSPNPRWNVGMPASKSGFRSVELSETARAMLRCSESLGMEWEADNDDHWKLFFMRWEPGRNSAQLAKGHRPEICLQGAGSKLVTDSGVKPVVIAGLELPVHLYVFTGGEAAYYVFYCLWEDRSSANPQSIPEDGSQESRIQAVLSGKRHIGQQVLEVSVHGPSSTEEALASFAAQVGPLIQR
jgi:exosortase